MMFLCMDKRIAGFSIPQANSMRKAISKKKPNLVEKAKELFYESGEELGTTKALLDYVWDVQIAMQLGLSK